jgi:hypothetical protein
MWLKRSKPQNVTQSNNTEVLGESKAAKAGYSWIAKPSLYINPYPHYRLYMDTIFQENRKQEIAPWFAGCNNFMRINTVQYDSDSQVIRLALQEKKNQVPIIPWGYLVERLKSFGQASSYQWAETIQEFCLSYEKMMAIKEKNAKALLEAFGEKPGEMDPNEKRRDLLENSSILVIRYGMNEDVMTIKELIYNQNILSLTEYDAENMINFALNDGIPEIFHHDDAVGENIRLVVQNFFNPKVMNALPEFDTYLLTKDNYRKPVTLKMHVFHEYKEETGYEVELVLSFKEDPNRMLLKVDDMEQNQGRINELEAKEKDIQIFLKKFYGQNYIGKVYNSKKICRWRKL